MQSERKGFMDMNRWCLCLVMIAALLFVPIASVNQLRAASDDVSCWTDADRIDSDPPVGYQQWSNPPTMLIDPRGDYSAIMNTSKGTFVIELLPEAAPVTVNNFVCLALAGFYDNTSFHRIIPGFVIQGGDPTGTGTGNPGYRFDDEPVRGDYVRGTVAMANAGPNTNGSQFFVVLDDLRGQLQTYYTIFGSIEAGMDVVEAIASTPTQVNERGETSDPTEEVILVSVTIEGTVLSIEESAWATSTAVTQIEQTATAEAALVADAIAREEAWDGFFHALSLWVIESAGLPPGLALRSAERVFDTPLLPPTWSVGASYPVTIMGGFDDAWVTVLLFGSEDQANTAFREFGGGLVRSGWQQQEADRLEREHSCLTLVRDETSQGICYLIQGDALIVSYARLHVDAPHAALLNATDLADLFSQALDNVERPEE